MSAQGGACLGRMSAHGRWFIPACNGADTPPPVDRITDRCKNITLAQTSFAGGNKSNYRCTILQNFLAVWIVLIILLLFRDLCQLVWISKAQSMYGIGGEGRFLLQREAILIGSESFIEMKLLKRHNARKYALSIFI